MSMATRHIHPVDDLVQVSMLVADEFENQAKAGILRRKANHAVEWLRKNNSEIDELKAALKTLYESFEAPAHTMKAVAKLLGDWKAEPPIGFEDGDAMDVAAAGRDEDLEHDQALQDRDRE